MLTAVHCRGSVRASRPLPCTCCCSWAASCSSCLTRYPSSLPSLDLPSRLSRVIAVRSLDCAHGSALQVSVRASRPLPCTCCCSWAASCSSCLTRYPSSLPSLDLPSPVSRVIAVRSLDCAHRSALQVSVRASRPLPCTCCCSWAASCSSCLTRYPSSLPSLDLPSRLSRGIAVRSLDCAHRSALQVSVRASRPLPCTCCCSWAASCSSCLTRYPSSLPSLDLPSALSRVIAVRSFQCAHRSALQGSFRASLHAAVRDLQHVHRARYPGHSIHASRASACCLAGISMCLTIQSVEPHDMVLWLRRSAVGLPLKLPVIALCLLDVAHSCATVDTVHAC